MDIFLSDLVDSTLEMKRSCEAACWLSMTAEQEM